MNKREIFYAILEIGCTMALIGTVMENSLTSLGIVLIALSALAIRAQEEKAFRNNYFSLWSEMKDEAAILYFECGVGTMIMAIIITNTFSIVAVSGLYLIIVATGKMAKKRYMTKTSCKSNYRTTKRFISIFGKRFSRILGITSERCWEIMKFKGCLKQVEA